MRKIAFIDRDGTLIEEPEDEQVDNVLKIKFVPGVFSALDKLITAGYDLVMVSNQDGLGTKSFPTEDFEIPHEFMMSVFSSQGINFKDVLICPHLPEDNCDCRKPKLGLVLPYLRQTNWDRERSVVIGDRQTDIDLAANMGLRGYKISNDLSWQDIVNNILEPQNKLSLYRETNETKIKIEADFSEPKKQQIETGIGFFDHMLSQLAFHAGFGLVCIVDGDLEIDCHHSVEDVAIVLGGVLSQRLGDKHCLQRYGFVLPMDESLATAAIDLSGRPYYSGDMNFKTNRIGEFDVEMVSHFFYTLSQSLKASIHIKVEGDNTHHQIESIFKSFGRALGQAFSAQDKIGIPSTKGVL